MGENNPECFGDALRFSNDEFNEKWLLMHNWFILWEFIYEKFHSISRIRNERRCEVDRSSIFLLFHKMKGGFHFLDKICFLHRVALFIANKCERTRAIDAGWTESQRGKRPFNRDRLHSALKATDSVVRASVCVWTKSKRDVNFSVDVRSISPPNWWVEFYTRMLHSSIQC